MEPIKITTIEELTSLYAGHRVDTIYIKHLSPNQDNDKNQIYFGGGLTSITNIFPGKLLLRSESKSEKKPASKKGKHKLELNLKFKWITRNRTLSPAPTAKIIDYFQYPEIRFSGFLKGCENPPDALRRIHQDSYKKRILALGITPAGVTLGFVLTEVQDPVVKDFPELSALTDAPIIKILLVDAPTGETPVSKLTKELSKIISDGWHKSIRLPPNSTQPIPFKGNQGAGYTLEALLGISSNARGEPDKYGFEIKTYSPTNSSISVMTPTGDLGYRGKMGFRDFVIKYGHEGRSGDGRRHFTGKHSVGSICSKSGLLMDMKGYDTENFKIVGSDVEVLLINPKNNDVATGWSLTKIGEHWNRKHAQAIYIPYNKTKIHSDPDHDAEYQYCSSALIGEGTNIHRLLKAIATGLIYYDPGDEIEMLGNTRKSKERPQFRIAKSRIKETMNVLYDKVYELNLIEK